MELNPELKVGDRIICHYMEGDSLRVPFGTAGEVRAIEKVPFGVGYQYRMKWDNGSTLTLIPETDMWILESDDIVGKEDLNESIEKLKDVLELDGLNPEDFDEFIQQLKDEDITDEFLRNIDRKLLKSGDTVENVKKYLKKYIESLKIRQAIYNDADDSEEDDELEDFLLRKGGVEIEKSKLKKKKFFKELRPLQVELLKLQEMVKTSGKPFVIVFEGRDSAGKGTIIKTMTEYMDPKYFKVVALGIPTKKERKNWFQRYQSQMEPNKIILFDRSWYNRGIVEPVMGYSSFEEYQEFMEGVGPFEQSLVSAGVPLFKFWFSITKETQLKRFEMRQKSPLKYWKYSPNDAKSVEKWEDYTKYKKTALLKTKEVAPWYLIDTNDKRTGILNALRVVLTYTDYPDKEEKNIGMIYPEIVTSLKEGIIEEFELKTSEKLMLEVKELDNFFKKDELYSNFSPEDWDISKEYLETLRETGIVNMFGAPPYLYAPLEWIEDQVKWMDLSDDREEAMDKLRELHPKMQSALINAAISSLGDSEHNLSKINSKIQRFALWIVEENFRNW